MELNHKTVVITGGASGLGYALAEAFLAKGAEVHILGRTAKKVEEAVSQLGKGIVGHTVDVRDFDRLSQVAENIGTADVLINNAGVWLEGTVEEVTAEEIKTVIEINLTAVLLTTKAFLPWLKQAPEAHIVNVSSTSGLKGREQQQAYAASKFGVYGFSECLKIDLMDTVVKVTGFFPGGMSTDLFVKAGTPKDNTDWMNPKKVAQIISFIVEQDDTLVLDHVILNKRKTRFSH